jgi:hypothetical protein
MIFDPDVLTPCEQPTPSQKPDVVDEDADKSTDERGVAPLPT